MSFLNKRVEESIKQAKLLAQMSEMSYRSLNGTRQTRSSFTNNDLKEQPDTDKPAVGSLTSEMIAQYKREEEENNKYVDPTGKEFLYAPTGMTSKISLSTPSLVDVPSLGRTATVVDVSQERNNYAKIYQDIQDKKQEIEDKKRAGKDKEKQKAENESEVKELKNQRSEIYKLQLADEKQETAANKRLATLSKITNPKPEDLEEITKLNVEIPELQARIAEYKKNQTDLEAIYLPLETTDIPNLVKDIATLVAEIKQI